MDFNLRKITFVNSDKDFEILGRILGVMTNLDINTHNVICRDNYEWKRWRYRLKEVLELYRS